MSKTHNEKTSKWLFQTKMKFESLNLQEFRNESFYYFNHARSLLSKSSQILVVFQSDSSRREKGFLASYQAGRKLL